MVCNFSNKLSLAVTVVQICKFRPDPKTEMIDQEQDYESKAKLQAPETSMSKSMRAVQESKKPAGTKDEYEYKYESNEKVRYLQAPRTLPATWPATAPKQQVIGQAYKKHV